VLDAAEAVLTEQDPLVTTLEEIARAAGISRPLIHSYFGDRRGLIDAVQARLVGRLDDWVAHGLSTATSPVARVQALVHGVMAFVDQESDRWRLLCTSGGLDHPSMHRVRQRWVARIIDDQPELTVQAQAAVAAVIGAAGTWSSTGVDPVTISRILASLLKET